MRASYCVTIGLVAVAVSVLGGAPTGRNDGADLELQRLYKARFEAARAELDATMPVYRGGRMALDSATDSIERFGKSVNEAVETQAERVKQFEIAFETAKEVENGVRDKFKIGNEPESAVHLATYTRLDAEIRLHVARRLAANLK